MVRTGECLGVGLTVASRGLRVLPEESLARGLRQSYLFKGVEDKGGGGGVVGGGGKRLAAV